MTSYLTVTKRMYVNTNTYMERLKHVLEQMLTALKKITKFRKSQSVNRFPFPTNETTESFLLHNSIKNGKCTILRPVLAERVVGEDLPKLIRTRYQKEITRLLRYNQLSEEVQEKATIFSFLGDVYILDRFELYRDSIIELEESSDPFFLCK